MKALARIVKDAAARWASDHCYSLGASLAYYAVFSIFPLLLLAITVLGFFLGSDGSVRTRILASYAQIGSTDTLPLVEETLKSMELHQRSAGLGALAAGFMLIFGASGVFSELDTSLNLIWGVPPTVTKGFWQVVREALKDKALSFALVGVAALVLLASLAAGVAFHALAESAQQLLPSLALRLAEIALSFAALTAAFATLFRTLPRTYVAWRDVVLGALLTALLVTGLKRLFGSLLAGLWSYAVYGAVGAILGFLTWVYLVCQLIFFGAEVTRVYAERLGSRAKPIAPASDAA